MAPFLCHERCGGAILEAAPRPQYGAIFKGILEIRHCCHPCWVPEWCPALTSPAVGRNQAGKFSPVSLSCPVPGFPGQPALAGALGTFPSADSCLPSSQEASPASLAEKIQPPSNSSVFEMRSDNSFVLAPQHDAMFICLSAFFGFNYQPEIHN